jgi:glycosyltransferase involved in cell wall biosynthesis
MQTGIPLHEEEDRNPRGEQQNIPDHVALPISVIIPTYNRRKWLGEILDSLAHQTLPFGQFEVLIIDDGSSDATREIVQESYPFHLHYFYQTNQGDAAARNLGAKQSQAEILVFLDDDIILEKNFLVELLAVQEAHYNRIVVGRDILWLAETNPLHEGAVAPTNRPGTPTQEPIPFADVCSNNMSVRRDAYFDVGMMESLAFPGSSIWCDVDFSYRAYQKGFEFLRSRGAFCWHRDYVSRSLNSQIKRWREAAYRAVLLFHKYPELIHHLPMFTDKTPIVFSQDSAVLITRKLLRRIFSSRIMMFMMEKTMSLLPKHGFTERLARSLDQWIIGGYIFQGYWKGLQEFGAIKVSQNSAVPAFPRRNKL